MAPSSLSKPEQPKDLPIQTPAHDFPKQSIPLWVIVLFLLLISLIVGMGIYIGFQNNWFQTRPSSMDKVPTPSPTPAQESGTRTLRTTMKPDSTWLTYTNAEAGFMLKYPPTVDLNVEKDGSGKPVLTISVERVLDIPEEYPLGMDRKTALADKEALEKGKAQTIGDFASSDALIPLSGKGITLNSRMNSVLSRFEICSVIFSRNLTFYPGEYRVRISLDGHNKSITESMPEFFSLDSKNCGEQTMWVRTADKMGQFLPTLAKGEGKGAGQEWYDTFDGIIQTISLTATSSGTSPMVFAPSILPTPLCEVGDNAFCNVLNDIKTSILAKHYANIIAYQNITSVTCDPDGMFISICEGAPKGAVREGYTIGYNQSEGTIQTRDNHLASITSYITENGPFIYKGSLQEGDKGVIVYLNGDGSNLFVLHMKRIGMTWRFDSILVGGTFGDTRYSNLDPVLLQ